jgi:hypothetical protein
MHLTYGCAPPAETGQRCCQHLLPLPSAAAQRHWRWPAHPSPPHESGTPPCPDPLPTSPPAASPLGTRAWRSAPEGADTGAGVTQRRVSTCRLHMAWLWQCKASQHVLHAPASCSTVLAPPCEHIQLCSKAASAERAVHSNHGPCCAQVTPSQAQLDASRGYYRVRIIVPPDASSPLLQITPVHKAGSTESNQQDHQHTLAPLTLMLLNLLGSSPAKACSTRRAEMPKVQRPWSIG